MKRLSDFRILAAALVALTVLGVLTVLATPPPPAPPLSTRGAARDGAMALRLWLDQGGYETSELLSLDDLDRLETLFVLEPLLFHYTETDALRMQRWVQDGGTLIVAGTPFAVNTLLAPYNLSLEYLAADAQRERITPGAPSLLAPPFSAVQANAVAVAATERTDVVGHAFIDRQPVLVSFDEGAGRVWVVGALHPFTNQGLRDEGSAALVANLLAGLAPDAIVGFDENAHGFGAAVRDLTAWLLGTAPGQGVLVVCAIALLYFASSGRRFGRAEPLPDERLRRESVEYIQAIAGLFRRSGQRAEILKHYEGQLRRRLGERYAVDPRLEAGELIRSVVYHDPTLDEAKLRDLLKRLSQPNAGEPELIQVAADVHEFLRSLH